VFVTVFLIPFVMAGLYCIKSSLTSAQKARETARWHPTEATIQSCQVRVETDSDGDSFYHLDVHYTYTFRGSEHESRTLAKRTLASEGKLARETQCEKLLHRGTVTAYVNPECPAEAVLIRGAGLADYSGLAFGLTFAGFALMFWVIVAISSAAPDLGSLLFPARF
jgi:hypothetical protein